MKKTEYDDYEKELLELEEQGHLMVNPASDEENAKYVAMAREHNKKTERITVRLTAHDLIQLKLNANRKGIPYQTLVTSLIHQYNTGEPIT